MVLWVLVLLGNGEVPCCTVLYCDCAVIVLSAECLSWFCSCSHWQVGVYGELMPGHVVCRLLTGNILINLRQTLGPFDVTILDNRTLTI